jgi:hypothetical protein
MVHLTLESRQGLLSLKKVNIHTFPFTVFAEILCMQHHSVTAFTGG